MISETRSSSSFVITRIKHCRGGPEGAALLLRKLRGESIDWAACQECRAPTAKCSACRKRLDISHFTDAQWELARANRPTTCADCSACEVGERRRQGLKKAKPTYICAGCGHAKIEDAFPRAQLEQSNAATKQRCLKCIQTQAKFLCQVCELTKAATHFQPEVLTIPEGSCCKACQPLAGSRTRGWFTCRGCKAILPISGTSAGQMQRCANCKTRAPRDANMHSCKKCGNKFPSTFKPGGDGRERLCSQCRPSRVDG